MLFKLLMVAVILMVVLYQQIQTVAVAEVQMTEVQETHLITLETQVIPIRILTMVTIQ